MKLRTANTRAKRRRGGRWSPIFAFTVSGSLNGVWTVGATYAGRRPIETFSFPGDTP